MTDIIEKLKNGKKNNDDDSFIIIEGPDTPTEDIDFLYIAMGKQSDILQEEGISFPITMDQLSIIIEPTEENIRNGSFTIEGIAEVIESFYWKLKYSRPFLNCQLLLKEGESIPSIHLHLLLFKKAHGQVNVPYESLLYFLTFPEYDENIFTEKRKFAITEKGLNVEFLRYIPNMTLCPIHFNEEGNLQPLKSLEETRKLWS